MKHTDNFIFRIDPNTRENLKRLSASEGKSQSEVIRRLIDQAAAGSSQHKQPQRAGRE